MVHYEVLLIDGAANVKYIKHIIVTTLLCCICAIVFWYFVGKRTAFELQSEQNHDPLIVVEEEEEEEETMAEKLDWSKLPTHLQYLAGPAEKYGRYQFDDAIIDFFQNEATDAEKKELKMIDDRFVKDEVEIKAWYRKLDITKHAEARLVYFLGHLLAIGNDDGYLQPKP